MPYDDEPCKHFIKWTKKLYKITHLDKWKAANARQTKKGKPKPFLIM
jgi:hypothetical protein